MATARSMTQRSRAVLSSVPTAGGVQMASAGERSGSLAATVDEVSAGRLSLGMLGVLVLILAGFYVWTRDVQGGG